MTRWLMIAVLGLLPFFQEEPRHVWLVFSPETPLDMERVRAWPRPVRLVLAVDDFFSGSLPATFLENVRDLKDWLGGDFNLPVIDAEALARVRDLGVRRLPAILVFERGRTHIIEGLPRSPEEVLPCR